MCVLSSSVDAAHLTGLVGVGTGVSVIGGLGTALVAAVGAQDHGPEEHANGRAAEAIGIDLSRFVAV